MADFTLSSQHHIKWDLGGMSVPGWGSARAILFCLSGIAAGAWYGVPDGWNGTSVHFDIPFPDGESYRYLHWAPSVALASIGGDVALQSSGWAVDGFRILRTDQSTRFIYMEADVNARGSGGAIWRLAYNVQVIVYRG